ncbi:PPK2 family polyphosphate:nucleotide phosphotransferase [Paenibacillus shirakamiensis]|uniref:PPK2 family polyphosphate:nucleotide phosphotransferase n=1 Tax=Paenibacillus shirakamiensis TaxID=1265935 RepID=A0ABS4JJN9_9BACL|nr:PPK2 family polyphosphate kinase [Paenibacillus shirakamiensis]MBP2001206.1 PPK2 family polyphosphate:nucleotide phosphotransferase [Paenibacillus shirakamiensis]
MDIKKFRIKQGEEFSLEKADPSNTSQFKSKEEAEAETESLRKRLVELQDILYAEKKHSVLVILQGMDTSGKDGTIKHIFSGINPQGFNVTSFKKPTAEELSRDFLWRIHEHTPAKGYIAAFNRSQYEDILVPKVHGTSTDSALDHRLKHIQHFEDMLSDEGTKIVKIFLHISKDKQLEKIHERMKEPRKFWKFDPTDLLEREYWDAYQSAYEEVLSATSTAQNPWYWVPANHKWFRNYLVLRILVQTLEGLNLEYPALQATPSDLARYMNEK